MWVRARDQAKRWIARFLGSENVESVKAKPDEFPPAFLRGIRSAKWIVNGDVTFEAFMGDKRTAEARKKAGKPPGEEASVNWEENPNVEAFTFQDRANTEHGIARVPLAAIVHQNKQPGSKDALLTEWDRLGEVNPYHGNIVYQEGVVPHKAKAIASSIALSCEHIPRPNKPKATGT